MSIYAISDLHLSFGDNKPMDIFGVNWENHAEKIRENWVKKVKEDDLVLLPGDFSWAMYLKDTYKDFEFLNSLPGKKLLLKGNHDYWWTTIKKMREYLVENKFENIDFVYNNSYEYKDKIIVGTRGWQDGKTAEDRRLIKRENFRLELSLKDGIIIGDTNPYDGEEIVEDEIVSKITLGFFGNRSRQYFTAYFLMEIYTGRNTGAL